MTKRGRNTGIDGSADDPGDRIQPRLYNEAIESQSSSHVIPTLSDALVGVHSDGIPGAFAICPGDESDSAVITRTSPPIGTPEPEIILVTQAWPVEDDVVYQAQDITNFDCEAMETGISFIPVAVKHILFSTQRRGLLPRHEEVLKVVKCLLKQDTESTDNRSANIGNNATDDVNTPAEDTSTVQGNGVGESNFSQDFGIPRDFGDNDDFLIDHGNAIFFSSDKMTFLQGMGGLGKTTVAALAISREDVRRHFHGGIAWIKIGQQKLGSTANFDGISSSLSYGNFMYHIRTICLQLRVTLPHFSEIVFLPGDDAHI